MAIREIMKKGEPCLTKKCHAVTNFDKKLFSLLDDMRETLLAANGVGLAAPQVGILRRVVLVWDVNREDSDRNPVIYELINPELVEVSEETEDGTEGCLSVPGVYGYVERPVRVTVRAQNRKGEFYEVTGEGIVARCFCHETEHLDGHLFTEKVTRYVEDDA